MRHPTAVLFILVAVTINVAGQLIIKMGLNRLGALDFSQGAVNAYQRMLLSPYVLLGSFTYAISILFWLYALSKVELSYAFPFLALSYVLILLVSWLFLGEQVTPLRIAGVLVICFGVFLVSRS
jgi:drug/metabolite transporter (DMT)-like permease